MGEQEQPSVEDRLANIEAALARIEQALIYPAVITHPSYPMPTEAPLPPFQPQDTFTCPACGGLVVLGTPHHCRTPLGEGWLSISYNASIESDGAAANVIALRPGGAQVLGGPYSGQRS